MKHLRNDIETVLVEERERMFTPEGIALLEAQHSPPTKSDPGLTIWIVKCAVYLGVVIDICWRGSQEEAESTARALQQTYDENDRRSHRRYFATQVTETPLEVP